MQTKLPVKSRVADKYKPMLTYYAELIGMDKSIDAKKVAEKLETISKTNEQRSHVA